MVFGKREKIVAGGVIAAVLMAGLHLFLFSPRVAGLSESAAKRDEQQNALKAMKIADQKEIDRLTSATTVTLDKLTSGVQALGMFEHEAFVVELPVAPDPKVTPTNEDFAKNAEATRVKVEQQIPLLLEEVRKLQDLARAAAAGNGTRFSFVNGPPMSNMWTIPQGWALPLALPKQLIQDPAKGSLWDTLAKIAGVKGNLNAMTPGTNSYNLKRIEYYNLMSLLGVDYFYFNGNTNLVNQRLYGWPGTSFFGEFVPLIDKMALANLILDQLKEFEAGNPPVIIQNKHLGREFVFDIVEIDLYAPYGPATVLEGLKENKLYFMYEEVKNLNHLLKLAMEHQLTDVTQVTFDGYAFLRQAAAAPPPAEIPADLTKLKNDEDSIGVDSSLKTSTSEEEEEEGMMMDDEMYAKDAPDGGGGGEAKKEEAEKAPPGLTVKRPDEIGIALPIKIVYQATNDKMWKFAYDVLRTQPMTELQRMAFRTLSQFQGFQNNPNVETTVTFVIVPKMFEVVDNVRKQLQAIKAAQAAKPAQAAEPADAQ